MIGPLHLSLSLSLLCVVEGVYLSYIYSISPAESNSAAIDFNVVPYNTHTRRAAWPLTLGLGRVLRVPVRVERRGEKERGVESELDRKRERERESGRWIYPLFLRQRNTLNKETKK